MERVIDRHIRETVLLRTPLRRNQHAYDFRKSCDSALHCYVTKVDNALDYKNLSLRVFLDIEGGFNILSFQSV